MVVRTHRLTSGEPARCINLVHGFTQNSRCWGDFVRVLSTATDAGLVGIDAPGHGESTHDDADLLQAAELVLAAAPDESTWLGYSMGGRMLLHAAVAGERFEQGLVLIGSTPGIRDEAERNERRTRDAALAERCEAVGTQRFIDEWLATPLFSHLTVSQACRAARLLNRAEGMAGSLRNCGTGSQLPLWDDLSVIEAPVLVMAGRSDEKFTNIGRTMVEAIGANARFVGVSGGHAVHLENPQGTAAAIAEFRSSLG